MIELGLYQKSVSRNPDNYRDKDFRNPESFRDAEVYCFNYYYFAISEYILCDLCVK